MTWDAVLPLIGVALGAGGSFAVQFLVTRASREQARLDRLASLRAERKDAIREFLENAQSVERAAERRFLHDDVDHADVVPLTHRMWCLQKCIDLVGSPELRKAASGYAWRLHDVMYKEQPESPDVWERIRELRDPFLEAARVELGVSGLADEVRPPSRALRRR